MRMPGHRPGWGRALASIDDRQRLDRGIVLPIGYELVNVPPQYSPERMAMLFLVESQDLPETAPGLTLPQLSCLPGYEVAVVEPWRG